MTSFKHTVLRILFCVACLSPSIAWGAAYQQLLPTGIQNAPLNGNANSLTTNPLLTDGYTKLTLQVIYFHSSATNVNLSCSGSLDGVTFGKVQSIALSSGVGTLSDYTYTKSVSGNTSFIVNLGMNYKAFQCTASAPGASSGDTITLLAMVQVQSQ